MFKVRCFLPRHGLLERPRAPVCPIHALLEQLHFISDGGLVYQTILFDRMRFKNDILDYHQVQCMLASAIWILHEDWQCVFTPLWALDIWSDSKLIDLPSWVHVCLRKQLIFAILAHQQPADSCMRACVQCIKTKRSAILCSTFMQ